MIEVISKTTHYAKTLHLDKTANLAITADLDTMVNLTMLFYKCTINNNQILFRTITTVIITITTNITTLFETTKWKNK